MVESGFLIGLTDQPLVYRQQVFWTDPQSGAFDRVTPADYVKSMLRLYPRFDHPLLNALIVGLSLAPHLQKAIYMLSAGSKRKVWLAKQKAQRKTTFMLSATHSAAMLNPLESPNSTEERQTCIRP